MADVRFTLEVTIPTATDAVVVAAMQDVDIIPVLQERERQFTLCNDSTAIDSPGTVQRTIVAELTAEFESKFPTFDNQLSALKGAFKNRFSQLLPARVEETVEIGAFCP